MGRSIYIDIWSSDGRTLLLLFVLLQNLFVAAAISISFKIEQKGVHTICRTKSNVPIRPPTQVSCGFEHRLPSRPYLAIAINLRPQQRA
jgi:hypothetical protein